MILMVIPLWKFLTTRPIEYEKAQKDYSQALAVKRSHWWVGVYHFVHFVVFASIVGLMLGVFIPEFFDAKYECRAAIELDGDRTDVQDACMHSHGDLSMD